MKTKCRFPLILVVGFSVGGCHLGDRGRSEISDDADMKAYLSKHVPQGTRLDEAKRFMKAEGFKCSMHMDSAYSENENAQEYLYCDRSDNVSDSPFISRRWQIALVIQNEAISDIRINSGLIGP